MFREAFPILSTPDLGRAMRFYCDVLGFESQYRFPTEGEPEFVTLRLESLKLGLGANPEVRPGRHFALWLYTDDVDEAVGRLRAAGVPILREPQDMPWGERIATAADPDDNQIHLGAAIT
ncbi:VOC family protein [Saccharopolyspora elongata]|uniref:Bleomycin resistance protein n=1 Tax=Saccharopolyspora elongata TaxID=2530387 RepID=A0A4R4Z2Q9_9PSEU|nr:VOC family protein [Saccharopolyspora elongata]TDD52245.1 bleomycin resistance protein [Saccharopolyspora elongata]